MITADEHAEKYIEEKEHRCKERFFVDPHIASVLAFNRLNHIGAVPDDIDVRYGLTYTQ